MERLAFPVLPRLARSETTILVAGFALAFLVTVTAVDDHDIFWHLATGKLILAQGIPTQNTFSFTHPAYPWHPTEWLFDVVISLLHRFGGFVALSLFTAAIYGLCAVVTLDTGRLLTGRLAWLQLLPLSVLLLFSRFRASPRPHLFTFLFLALLLNLWFRRRERRARVLAAALGALWSNLHAGVVFGTVLLLLLLLGLAGDRLLSGTWRSSRDDLAHGGSLALWFIPCTLLNPSFLYPYVYSFGHLGVRKLVEIEEFARAGISGNELFFLFAALLALLFPRLPREIRFQTAGCVVPFFLLSLTAARIIPKFGMIAAPFLMLALSERPAKARPDAPSGLMIARALLLAAALFGAFRDLGRWPPSVGLDARDFPVGAAEFIKQNDIPGDFYNDFDDGGYLIHALYPRKRVFQDGRVPHYPEPFWREIALAMSPESWEALLERYGATGAIVKRRAGGYDYSAFVSSERWNLAYRDDNSFVFLKKPAR